MVLLFLAVIVAAGRAPAQTPPARRIPIMIVAVDHLVSAYDLHNSTKFDPLTPERQAQIIDAMQHVARFKPTRVMVEAPYGNAVIAQRYAGYRAGTYTLGANEVYQYGFRLAGMVKSPAIYPIDTQGGVPFDYDSVKKSAQTNGQTSIIDAAEAYTRPVYAKEDQLEQTTSILETLQRLNDPASFNVNAAWYLYIDRIGDGKDYAGADLVSYWYARNLHIFANIRRSIGSQDDRVVVFIAQGHVPILRQCVELSPDMELIDPEPYLK